MSNDVQLLTQQQLNKLITDKVGKLLGAQLEGQFTSFTDPSGFNYGITYGSNAWYNAATLKTFDSRFETDGDFPHLLPEKFSDLYLKVLQTTVFKFSKTDQNLINKEDTAAETQIANVISAYKNAGFPIPDPLPDETPSAFLYITSSLTKKYGDLENIPDTLNELRNSLASYKEAAESSFILHRNANIARKRLSDAIKNISTPNSKNGGLQTDAAGFYPGYEKLPVASAIVSSLNTNGNAISISIKADTFSETQSHLVIEKDFSVSVSLPFFLKFSVEHNSEYTLDTFVSSQSALDIEISYPGVTLVSAAPLAQSSDGKVGWYDLSIIQEAAQKTGVDATGYALQGGEFEPKQLFGHSLARVKTFVISNIPTITMKFSKVDVDKVTSVFKEHKSVQFKLFSLFSIGESTDYSVQSISTDVSSQSVFISFGPPAPSGSIPLDKQTAFILGGVSEYPAAGQAH